MREEDVVMGDDAVPGNMDGVADKIILVELKVDDAIVDGDINDEASDDIEVVSFTLKEET